MTVAELEKELNMTRGRLATKLGAQATDKLTWSMLENAMASGKLSRGQIAMIANLMKTSAATKTATVATRGFSFSLAALKAEMLAMVATPMGLIMTLLTVLPLAIQGVKKVYDMVVTTSEEAYEAAEAHTETYEQLKTDLESLANEQSEIQTKINELELLK